MESMRLFAPRLTNKMMRGYVKDGSVDWRTDCIDGLVLPRGYQEVH